MKNISSCLTDDGGGNLLLYLLSKTDHSRSMITDSGDCAGQGNVHVHLHDPHTETEHFWLCVCVCVCARIVTLKIASLL